jgi:hypothetical protein
LSCWSLELDGYLSMISQPVVVATGGVMYVNTPSYSEYPRASSLDICPLPPGFFSRYLPLTPGLLGLGRISLPLKAKRRLGEVSAITADEDEDAMDVDLLGRCARSK